VSWKRARPVPVEETPARETAHDCHPFVTQPVEMWRARQDSNLWPSAPESRPKWRRSALIAQTRGESRTPVNDRGRSWSFVDPCSGIPCTFLQDGPRRSSVATGQMHSDSRSLRLHLSPLRHSEFGAGRGGAAVSEDVERTSWRDVGLSGPTRLPPLAELCGCPPIAGGYGLRCLEEHRQPRE